jgi:hypothetical protein
MTPPLKYVTPGELRKRFNDGRYFERLQVGEFVAQVPDIGQAPARFPGDIRSQIVAYLDQSGLTVAIVHQYGRQNADPAEGTRPDPKFLFEGGVRYKLSRIAT